MQEKNLYIIAGCNGAGKTTASFTILPEILECKEFVNADEIAKGLSPFQPEKVAFEAGRIMIERVNHLLKNKESFALETTLATRSYKSKLIWAQENGYTVKLLFFWLPTIEMAVERVAVRVSEGGHHIPKDVIARRYKRGIANLFKIYLPLSSEWIIFDNSKNQLEEIANGAYEDVTEILHQKKFDLIKSSCS